jgi:DNA helicase IV
LANLQNIIGTYVNYRSTLFWLHQKRERKRHKVFFDTVESNPLTDLQRRSVILNEHRNLVVAGAGTGKTSVVVAKVGYLIRSGKFNPEDILLLTYNRAAAKELTDRCKQKVGIEIKAETFHALGSQIIGEIETNVPSVSKLATDKAQLDFFLQTVLEKIRENPQASISLREFVLGHLKPYRAEHTFRSMEEYLAYTKSVELRALSGDLVRSFAELDIANYLFLKGIKFEYEKRYPHIKSRYQPDFFLSDYDIYLEHFGVDRNGNTASYINAVKYRKDMEWKRQQHAKFGTKLIETYSWQKSEGILLETLRDFLRDLSVKTQPVSDKEMFSQLKEQGYFSQLGKLINAFLSHFKSNQMTFKSLKALAKKSEDKDRAIKFLALFEYFYKQYQDLLSSPPNEIDFHDMVSKATEYVEENVFSPPWKYIIVDEFQDISIGRYKLIMSFLDKKKELQLFAVGDDWQSIYRFAGSDISLMKNFKYYFGKSAIVQLDKTFRFNSNIADVSGKFIQKNPKQIKKKLSTLTQSETPQVFLHWKSFTRDSSDNPVAQLSDVIEWILAEKRNVSGTLLILARYNHLLKKISTSKSLETMWPGKVLAPKTIHSSKGLESDYVILLGVGSGKHGFPSEMEDDPLLELVLAEPDKYANAEERRLLYVALTRAKHQVHLVVNKNQISTFAKELSEDGYDIVNIGRSFENDPRCPDCRTGFIEERVARFFGCSNYPLCKYTAPLCPKCGSKPLTRIYVDGTARFCCSDENCNGGLPSCPECESGAVVQKTGKYGMFFSCHTHPRCSYSYKPRRKRRR